MADSTYYFYYDFMFVSVLPARPTDRYVRTGNTIDFYLAGPFGSFYANLNGHFARGSLKGDVMNVKYEDYVDFDDEVYVRQ